MRIEVWKSKESARFYWHLRARNGRIVSDAEAFASKSNAIRAAKATVTAVRGKAPTFTATIVDGVTHITWQ